MSSLRSTLHNLHVIFAKSGGPDKNGQAERRFFTVHRFLFRYKQTSRSFPGVPFPRAPFPSVPFLGYLFLGYLFLKAPSWEVYVTVRKRRNLGPGHTLFTIHVLASLGELFGAPQRRSHI